MADGRISEITGSKSATGGVGTLDYVVKWYFVATPTQVKTKAFTGLPPDDFETELDAYATTESVTFI